MINKQSTWLCLFALNIYIMLFNISYWFLIDHCAVFCSHCNGREILNRGQITHYHHQASSLFCPPPHTRWCATPPCECVMSQCWLTTPLFPLTHTHTLCAYSNETGCLPGDLLVIGQPPQDHTHILRLHQAHGAPPP